MGLAGRMGARLLGSDVPCNQGGRPVRNLTPNCVQTVWGGGAEGGVSAGGGSGQGAGQEQQCAQVETEKLGASGLRSGSCWLIQNLTSWPCPGGEFPQRGPPNPQERSPNDSPMGPCARTQRNIFLQTWGASDPPPPPGGTLQRGGLSGGLPSQRGQRGHGALCWLLLQTHVFAWVAAQQTPGRLVLLHACRHLLTHVPLHCSPTKLHKVAFPSTVRQRPLVYAQQLRGAVPPPPRGGGG